MMKYEGNVFSEEQNQTFWSTAQMGHGNGSLLFIFTDAVSGT